jgi:hypothetical protein
MAVARREIGAEWEPHLAVRQRVSDRVATRRRTFVVGEVLWVRRRAWLGTVPVPIGLFAGLVVILDGI